MNGLRIKEPNMNPRLTFSFVSAAFLALATTGLLIKADPAIAQQAAAEIEEIVVGAPIVRRQVERTTSGAKVETIELRRRVGYANLDLSKYADVTELKRRIETTAKESCKQLSDMFPSDPSDRSEIRRCANKAVDGTEEQVQAAIAAAS
jgi:UrcA family protein